MTAGDSERLQRLFELSLDILCVLDRDGRLLLVSPSVERVLGHRPADVVGRSVLDYLHPDDAEGTAAQLRRIDARGTVTGYETRFRHADGSYRWLLWSTRRSEDDGHFYAAGRDVSDRHAVGEELLATVRSLEDAQRVARLGSYEWDLERRVASYTPEVLRIFGHAMPADPAAFLEVVHPDDRCRIADQIEAVVRFGGSAATDYRLAEPPERILHGRIEAVAGEDGRTRIMRGTVQDVTAARRQEQRLREREERLEEAERLAGMGSWEWSPAAGQLLWSAGLYRLWDVDPVAAPLSRDAFLGLLRPAEREAVLAAIRDSLDRDGRFEVEFHVPVTGGRDRVLVTRGEAFEHEGEPRVRGTVQDVTAQRLAAEQQALVAQLGRVALESRDIDRILDEAAVAATAALGVPYAIVLRCDEHGALRAAASAGLPAQRGRALVEPDEPSCSREALTTRATILVADWAGEGRFPLPDMLHRAGVRSSAVVPVLGRERPFGILAAHSPVPGHLTEDDVTLLEVLASIVATAVDRVQGEEAVAALAGLRGRLVAEALEAEERVRRRISEALHDGALQDLLTARQDLVEAAGPGGDPVRMIGYARGSVESAVRRLREAVQALHPVVLQHGGLEAALQAAAEQVARQGGFAADVHVDGDATGARDELVLSLARELLTNAAKHAAAREVRVAVRRENGAVVLEVADDGRGADPAAVAAAPLEGHIGLASIAQRAEAVGGAFELRSAPGAGTVARAVLPVREPEAGRPSAGT